MSDDLDPTVAPESDEPGLLALSAFVDGELPEAERRAVAERLADDAHAADVASHYRAQRAALRALFADPAAQSGGPASCCACSVKSRPCRRSRSCRRRSHCSRR
ncbi:hypothetical protein, partial [Burkholderia oklahomensis]|uniref:anti-sigma factor family protein n=1 Tax=Burkholderia oklahomensis TaxID=342113 RepID=UPI00016A7531